MTNLLNESLTSRTRPWYVILFHLLATVYMAFVRHHALFDLLLKLTLQFVSSHPFLSCNINNSIRCSAIRSRVASDISHDSQFCLYFDELFMIATHMQGVLLSNETIQITVRAYIDNTMALILNQGPRDLSATLILHTVLGKDHFISVSGEYS